MAPGEETIGEILEDYSKEIAGFVILTLVVLIAIVCYSYRKNIKEFWTKEETKEAIKNFPAKTKEAFKNLPAKAKEALKNFPQNFKNLMKSVAEWFKKVFAACKDLFKKKDKATDESEATKEVAQTEEGNENEN